MTKAAASVMAGPRLPVSLLAVLLVAATILAYQPAWHAGFIWDDDHHVTRPELSSPHGLGRIWTEFGATLQYYPLVHSVFWVEHRIWGEAAAPYHWVNILLHAFSALLVAKILQRLEIPGAWLAAGLFALHPVEVESVAWVSELKNTLSGVFYLSAALVYLGFDRNRRGRNYVAALGLFLLGLMSKTVVATLPAALLVVFWWQRGKLSWKRDVAPLSPFFAAGIGAGWLTAWMERKFIGAQGADFQFSIIERCLIAGRDIWFYLGKLGWPADLIFIYPRWHVNHTVWWQYLFPAAALALVGVLLWRGWRGPLAALLFFVGTLFPALGFFNVYPFRFSFVADHFQYLASLGPLTLAAVGLSAAAGFIRERRPIVKPLMCAALLLALGTLTWKQCALYADAQTLWQTTIRHNPDCWLAWNNLGAVLDGKGQLGEAINHLQEAIRLKPDYAEPQNNLGSALGRHGQIDEAIDHLRKAIRLAPGYAEAHNNLGAILGKKGQLDEAISHYQEAIHFKPDFADAHNNLGSSLEKQGRTDEAISQFREAIRLNPNFADAFNNLGAVLARNGQIDEAVSRYQEAVRLQPNFAQARYNLGLVLGGRGQIDEALIQFQEAIRFKPDFAEAHNKLGAALAMKGQIDQAIAHYQEAIRLKPDFTEARNNLDRAMRTKVAPGGR